jgi:ribosomal protein S18 acetylase RimI-like enzyme
MLIRLARPDDRNAMYDICVRTGDSGGDARPLYRDHELLGAMWVGPYLALEPELAFVAEDGEGVVGYVLGAEDTREFEVACEREWWPALRVRYPEPPSDADPGSEPDARLAADEALIRRFHHPDPAPAAVVARFPAHLHIDILPRGQGRGVGRRLIDTLLDALRDREVRGVHLGVGATNTRAIGFYRHLGFGAADPTQDPGAGGWLGLDLT